MLWGSAGHMWQARMTHQRMPFLRHLNPLHVNAAITATIVASSTPAAMQLIISKTLLVRKKEVGCKAHDQSKANPQHV